ncbi:hypothetical protein PPTG_18015 [Phytophthora nicotianae INRA-310]|uniref:Uncharacterized protein n=1 Tax=Phytophthora nicotianae (strain INRA-310) TaxID=761204 RepID=W2PHI9_PHYN3|nr:hypothetical protein PPTG_18015 [Phytophthora nicotianae INRA-310]ETN00307.1 hypothetical protein PPTG_18015 [Phytophthora nicotianae INRA-310]
MGTTLLPEHIAPVQGYSTGISQPSIESAHVGYIVRISVEQLGMESTASTVEVAEPMTEKAYDGGETISDEGERMQRVVATRTRSEKARVIARVCEDRTRESASEHHKEEREHAEGGGTARGAVV